MKHDPICPADELDRLIGLLHERRPESLGMHTLDTVAFVLERLRDAQDQDRVLPDPKDHRTWSEAKRDRDDEEILQLIARKRARS